MIKGSKNLLLGRLGSFRTRRLALESARAAYGTALSPLSQDEFSIHLVDSNRATMAFMRGEIRKIAAIVASERRRYGYGRRVAHYVQKRLVKAHFGAVNTFDFGIFRGRYVFDQQAFSFDFSAPPAQPAPYISGYTVRGSYVSPDAYHRMSLNDQLAAQPIKSSW